MPDDGHARNPAETYDDAKLPVTASSIASRTRERFSENDKDGLGELPDNGIEPFVDHTAEHDTLRILTGPESAKRVIPSGQQ
ncbi:MAG: hypothetical protein OXI81_01700 [Paracoccaceae bacterium]|nr:hypothetical protein [Paracoccaceae bacterium]